MFGCYLKPLKLKSLEIVILIFSNFDANLEINGCFYKIFEE